MWYCDFPFPSDPGFTHDAYSRYPHRGVSTQLLFYGRNLLDRHLFPGEILTSLATYTTNLAG